MRGSQVARAIALGLTSTTAFAAVNDATYDSSLNFRPDNVTSSDLYHWVGSCVSRALLLDLVPYNPQILQWLYDHRDRALRWNRCAGRRDQRRHLVPKFEGQDLQHQV